MTITEDSFWKPRYPAVLNSRNHGIGRVLESYYPLRVERWETIPDTGGAGLHGGGNGVDVA